MIGLDSTLDDPPLSRLVLTRHVIPAAIRCFFHVYEERIGTYGFRVLKHVLAYPGHARPGMTTGCARDVHPHEYVIACNNIVVDRTWCRACVAAIAKESRRGHSPTQHTPSAERIT